jgi:4-hydroxybenzoate polyprenyltransferase
MAALLIAGRSLMKIGRLRPLRNSGTTTDMTEKAAGFTDIRSGGWIDRLAPVWLRPYLKLARLDRPIGTWLLLFPCWWGLALASKGWPDPELLIAFALGSVVMRGAGCTYNDMVDREFDARVERTRRRPLPSGAISLRAAAVFLALQLLAGLAILFTFNTITIALGIASLALVFTYPFMKRVTWWPQAFLGLTFNWGVLMGWSAVTGDISLPALLLYTGAIAWTIGYDTIYAHQDKEDDALIGLRSTALLFGPQVAGGSQHSMSWLWSCSRRPALLQIWPGRTGSPWPAQACSSAGRCVCLSLTIPPTASCAFAPIAG